MNIVSGELDGFDPHMTKRATEKPLAFLEITPELLVEICKGLMPNNKPRLYRVVANGLPADCEFIYAKQDGHTIRLALRSSEFSRAERLPCPVLQSIESPTVYFARRWRDCDGQEILDIGMITTDKRKADEFCAKHEDCTVREIEDGEEWPIC